MEKCTIFVKNALIKGSVNMIEEGITKKSVKVTDSVNTTNIKLIVRSVKTVKVLRSVNMV